jgi:hypothetical protein
LELFDPYLRVTKRRPRYIFELLKLMPVQDVSRHLGLNWKTIKAIGKQFREEKFGPTEYRGLCILAIDEVSIHKGYRHLNLVLGFESSRVVWDGEGCIPINLKIFFSGMSREPRKELKVL